MAGTAPAGVTDSAGHGLVMDCAQTEAGLVQLAAEWDALLAQEERPSPFLRWDWVLTWWRQFYPNSGLMIITARRRSGELVGVAPLHVVGRRVAGVRVRSLELLGYRGSAVCVDHLDFIAHREGREHIVRALAGDIWRRRRDWDAVILADLAEDSLLPALWPILTGNSRFAIETAQTCYFRVLNGDARNLWRDIGDSHPELVRNVLRYQRRLDRRYQVRFIPNVPTGEIDATLAALARLHTLSRARQGQSSNFELPDYLAFHREAMQRLAQRDALYLARLECDGRIAAVFYGLMEGGVLYYYQSGFDTGMRADGVGKLLLARVLEDAATRLQAHEFDFLRGTETYKTQWADRARQTRTVYGWQSGVRGSLARQFWQVRRRMMRWRARVAAMAHGHGRPGTAPGAATGHRL